MKKKNSLTKTSITYEKKKISHTVNMKYIDQESINFDKLIMD